jgi:Protein of unknown function (DUF3443)
VRKLSSLSLAFCLVLLASCGGGGKDTLAGGSGNGQVIASAASNVASITVDTGPAGGPSGIFNTAYVSVTLCAPGSTTNCQTIDHMLVDTGSYGVRVIASVVNSALLTALPVEEVTGSGQPIAECTIFADGYSWGSVRTATIEISGETTTRAIPIEVMGDPNFPNVPTGCSTSTTGSEEDTVALFGANGVVGVGPFPQDCGGDCVGGTPDPALYYSCATAASCAPTPLDTLTQEVANPVASFTTDNNGVIVELPSVPDAGSLTVTGALVFGIDTESNNGLGSATVLTTDPNTGNITITYKGSAFDSSFIDSGSNLNYFDDNSISLCPDSSGLNGYYCPNSELSLSATNTGVNGVSSTVSFNVASAQTIFNNNPSFTAFNNLAAQNLVGSNSFDFGLPFFYGRNVFVAIDGMNTSGGMGPYFAY